TAPFDHCNMTTAPGLDPSLVARFRELLLGMSWDDPEVRPLLELEGLKVWQPGRTSGYAILERAVTDEGFYDNAGAITAQGYDYCPGTAMSHLDPLESIVDTVIAPRAAELDRTASFPREAIDALGQAGLLGLISATDVGGMGLGLAEATQVVERIARDCPATAMVVTMHYAGTTLVEKYGPEDVRRDIAAGRHLTTLAWSESGSRSHF